MRDVKNHICRSLDMHGLVEDDHGMELLVAGRIVALHLPIHRVFQQVTSHLKPHNLKLNVSQNKTKNKRREIETSQTLSCAKRFHPSSSITQKTVNCPKPNINP